MDIATGQKRVEEDLKKSLSILQATVESTTDGILVVDRAEKIVMFNRKFLEMWRIPDSIAASKDDSKAIEFVLDQLKDPGLFTHKIRELYSQPEAKSFDILEFKDGRIFERYSKPQKLDSECIGRVWSFRDVTEQKNSEKTLAKQTLELMRSNADLEQFASVASHDLKEPLRMISNYLQLLEAKYSEKIDEDGQRIIRRAVGGAKRMNALIEDLLTYSRVGRSEEGLKEFEAEKILEQSLENLKPHLEESGVVVEHGPLPKVIYVETELLQVFQNLIGNAVKFRGGKKPAVRVDFASQDGEWIFSVADNGIGIEPEFRKKIFMIFTRLHGRDKYEGTGIGLALCKKIVESRSGRIWVESEPGRGSTFFFTIPKGGNHA